MEAGRKGVFGVDSDYALESGWKVMLFTRGDQGPSGGERVMMVSRPSFPEQLSMAIWPRFFCAVLILFLIHVVWLCQVPGEEGVWQPHPSLLPPIWVCVNFGFGADVKGLHNGRLALGSPGSRSVWAAGRLHCHMRPSCLLLVPSLQRFGNEN